MLDAEVSRPEKEIILKLLTKVLTAFEAVSIGPKTVKNLTLGVEDLKFFQRNLRNVWGTDC